jgi:site-specific DNA recombinase
MAKPRAKTVQAMAKRIVTERNKAVMYARVSTSEQEKEGFSIPAQLKLIREYADLNGISVVAEHVDVETAKRAGRVGFEEMLRYIRSHPSVRTILVEKTDRLYRNLKDWVTVDGLDIEIHFVKENVVLSRDSRSSEKFMHGIKVLMAKNYIDNLSEETRKGMLEKAEQGIWPTCAPLGYSNVMGPLGKKVIVLDPEVGPLVTRVFEWFESGQYSIKEVTQMANAAGLRYRKSQKPVGGSTINTMLRNRIYTGSFEWLGKTYKGSHTPLTTYATWSNVQEILDGRSISNVHGNRLQFAYTGLITCGHCGCAVTAELKKGRYIYYHCSKFKGRCPERYVREEVLDEQFAAVLRRLKLDDVTFGLIERALRESHADERRDRDETIARLRAEADRLQHRLDKLYLDKLDGRVTDDFHDRVSATWREERDRTLRNMESLHCAEDDLIDDGLALLDFARTAHNRFAEQSLVTKRRALNLVLSNSKFAFGELTVSFREPFGILEKIATDGGSDPTPSGGRNAPRKEMAPRVGFEPTTDRLTVDCSTAELPRNTPPKRTRRPLCRQPTTLSRGFCRLL